MLELRLVGIELAGLRRFGRGRLQRIVALAVVVIRVGGLLDQEGATVDLLELAEAELVEV